MCTLLEKKVSTPYSPSSRPSFQNASCHVTSPRGQHAQHHPHAIIPAQRLTQPSPANAPRRPKRKRRTKKQLTRPRLGKLGCVAAQGGDGKTGDTCGVAWHGMTWLSVARVFVCWEACAKEGRKVCCTREYDVQDGMGWDEAQVNLVLPMCGCPALDRRRWQH